MKRLIVAGARGFFGAAVVDQLRACGLQPIAAARRSGPGVDAILDVEDGASLRRTLHAGDVLIDAAGPFQRRTTTLAEAAIEIGADVVDLSDSLDYAERLLAMREKFAAAGVRMLTSCSTVSTVSAAMIRWAGVRAPIALRAFLVPATSVAANPATAASLLASVGKTVRVYRAGWLEPAIGWSEATSYDLPRPMGGARGRLFESADSILLPEIWPSLRDATLYVDPHAPLLGAVLDAAARSPLVRRAVTAFAAPGLWLARAVGSSASAFGVRIAWHGGSTEAALVASERGYLTAVLPAVIAARALAEGRVSSGLKLPDAHVDSDELFAMLQHAGVSFHVRDGNAWRRLERVGS